MLAAEEGHEDVVKILLESGKVDVSCKDVSNSTALEIVDTWGNQGVAELLRRYKQTRTVAPSGVVLRSE